MKRLLPSGFLVISILALGQLLAQEKPPAAPQAPEAPKVEGKAAEPQPADAQKPEPKGPYRKLAPGVMIAIPPDRDVGETVSRHDLVEILADKPEADWAKDVPFHHTVWQLEFKFKPMRMIWVDMPQPSDKMQRKLIWYMVYSVTNAGKALVPVEDMPLPYEEELVTKQKMFQVHEEDQPIRFTPEFLLEARNSMKDTEGFVKVYPDRVIPLAVGPIQMREDPRRRLLTTVEVCRQIPVGETLWGVATWEDIDPKVVRFSVYVSGLTNAYRWIDPRGGYKPGDPLGQGRILLRKTLKLNFWRPGDAYFEHEEEIRYGTPGGVDYQWVYR